MYGRPIRRGKTSSDEIHPGKKKRPLDSHHPQTIRKARNQRLVWLTLECLYDSGKTHPSLRDIAAFIEYRYGVSKSTSVIRSSLLALRDGHGAVLMVGGKNRAIRLLRRYSGEMYTP
jgi:hypothetical protein